MESDRGEDGPVPYSSHAVLDVSDAFLYAAVALLPLDGTVLGISLPYWTPLSVWFFLAYVIANWRLLGDVLRRYAAFMLLPLLLTLVSVFGWTTIGFHPVAASKSIGSIFLGAACLAALEIGLRIKHLDWRPLLTVMVAAYSFAFLTGIVQWIGIHGGGTGIREFFERLMYRSYVAGRPQFLFAEPSYIGMHLYGVLLPVYWLTRDKRLAVLIPTFAAGAILMGAGTRIVVDTVVAAVLWFVADINVKRRGATVLTVAGVASAAVAVVTAVFVDPRLNKLATDGFLRGDGSMSARIFRALAPMWAWKHDLSHMLLGWGAGNVSSAVRTGYAGAMEWYSARGGLVNEEILQLSNPPVETFTMSAYVSVVTEFGVVGMAGIVILLVVGLTRHRAWGRRTVCWLILVAYLYLQFEAYAFYALPFMVWALMSPRPTAPVEYPV